MSTDVTMHDLELEHAELLPSRETLSCGGEGSQSSFSVTNVIGNTTQFGLINISAFNGIGNSVLSL